MKHPTIGILGGIGPESSAFFYKRLIELVQQRYSISSNTDYPHILLESIPAPDLLSEHPDIQPYTIALQNLEKGGADFIVIICNTAHLHLEHFKSILRIPIIDLKEEVATYFTEHGVTKIKLYASKNTTQLLTFDNVDIELSPNDELTAIDQIILDYNIGKDKEKLTQDFLHLINKEDTTPILIACTELSLLMKRTNVSHIDTLDILLDATLRKWHMG